MVPDRATARIIWETALDYLYGRVGKRKLAPYLIAPAPESLEAVYVQLLESLKNRKGMPKTIGPLDPLSPVLFAFSPQKTNEHYAGDWQVLFRRIREKVSTPGPMRKKRPQSYWVIFCKGALDGAAWLAELGDVRAFRSYVDGLMDGGLRSLRAPKTISRKIHGFGLALACDFLKESGWSQYAKPDVHTTSILNELGLCDGSDEATLKVIIDLAEVIGQTPFAVDKALWLVGSGWLYDHDEKFKTDRREFVQLVNQRLKEPSPRHAK